MTDNPENKTRTQDVDDPRSPKLPPPKKRDEAAAGEAAPDGIPAAGGIPTAGVSRKLKIFVIVLTVVTIGAFGIFTAMLVKKSASTSENNPEPAAEAMWDKQVLTVAEKLRDAGLHDQALTQYEKYLENPAVDLETRSNVAYIIGGLYMEMGNCGEAMAWFYHSEVAQARAPWTEDRNRRIDGCLNQLKSAP